MAAAAYPRSSIGMKVKERIAFFGPPYVLQPTVGRTPENPFRANVVDAHLVETDPGAEPAQELIGLRKSEQFLHDLPIHQREVARVERNRHVRSAAENAVEDLGEERQAAPSLRASRAGRRRRRSPRATSRRTRRSAPADPADRRRAARRRLRSRSACRSRTRSASRSCANARWRARGRRWP